MIGSLLKQLFVALGRFVRFQTRRALRLPDNSPVLEESAVQAEASTGVAASLFTTTDVSVGGLRDDIGLDAAYLAPVAWPCYRSDVPTSEVLSNALYRLWSPIPEGHKWTHYFPVYEAIFGPVRMKPLRILEIGIWQGASLQLWKQYFEHPDTLIVGVDILPECSRFDAPDKGVHVRIGDQADPAFLRQVVAEFGPFDLIIDDGSHHSSHIISSFNHLYADGLNDSGIYFVEDLHANYWHPWRDSRKSFLDVCKELLEHMHAHYLGASPVDFLIETPSVRPTTAIDVPRITTMIKEIRFFDSMVAIYKARLDYVPYYLKPGRAAQ